MERITTMHRDVGDGEENAHASTTPANVLDAVIARHPTASELATILKHHPQRQQLIVRLNQLRGNAFVQQVIAAGSQPIVTGPAFITGDIMYEQLAHRFAYQDELSEPDRAWLTVQGLRARPVVHGRGGFAMMSFVPLPEYDGKDRRPVLAFRGTNDLKDLIDDLRPEGVGAMQLATNEGLIANALVTLQGHDKGVAVTGHSLGGALAQMVAARFPDLVSKVVTFQSPGIPAAMATKVDRAKKPDGSPAIISHHYQVRGDLVGKAGERFTSGKVDEFDRSGGWGAYLFRHTSLPVTAVTHAQFPQYDGLKEDSAGAAAVPHLRSAEPTWIETARHAIGEIGRTVSSMTTLGASRERSYLAVWQRVRSALDNGADYSAMVGLIDHEGVTAADRDVMKENLAEIVMARDAARGGQ